MTCPSTRLAELMPKPAAPAKPGEDEPGQEAYTVSSDRSRSSRTSAARPTPKSWAAPAVNVARLPSTQTSAPPLGWELRTHDPT